MSQCLRCGDTIIHGAPERFRLRAWDYAESSGTLHDGHLCVCCWNDLLRFMTEDPCDPRWSTA